jgi:hypothetical protein
MNAAFMSFEWSAGPGSRGHGSGRETLRHHRHHRPTTTPVQDQLKLNGIDFRVHIRPCRRAGASALCTGCRACGGGGCQDQVWPVIVTSRPSASAYQTAGSPFADGGGIALTTVAPPGRRHHPGGHGDEIAAAIISRTPVPMGAC